MGKPGQAKQKTKKAVAKRFKKTAGGKILRSSASRGHLFTSKSRKRKRQLAKGAQVSASDYARIVNLLPR